MTIQSNGIPIGIVGNLYQPFTNQLYADWLIVNRLLFSKIPRCVIVSRINTSLCAFTGVGCALLFLNIVILIGVCCQRDKLRTERKAIEKLTQVGGPLVQAI